MRTIGEIIKDARVKKKYSIKRIADITKIKSDFIDAIEKENWPSLPNFSTTLGFVKSLAGSLDLEEKSAVAVFKRDYPPKSQQVSPKPDLISKFSWSPKATFTVGIAIAIILVLGYLGIEYSNFLSAPQLRIETPIENQVVDGRYVVVSGSTDTDAKIEVNNQPVLVSPDGRFLVGIEIVPETSEIEIKAIARNGKETVVKRDIKVESN